MIKRAVQLGLRMALGNDTNHGCIAEEIAFVERAGMSRREALLAATRYGADLCGLESLTGTIEPGKEADLIAICLLKRQVYFSIISRDASLSS